jgi:GAF domain-containing protein
MVAGEPQIRFYAGAPLIAPNRHILGALCVLGQLLRQLSLDQSESLRILSKQVMAQVILGMNLQDLKAALRARDDLEHDMEELILNLQESTTRKVDDLKEMKLSKP